MKNLIEGTKHLARTNLIVYPVTGSDEWTNSKLIAEIGGEVADIDEQKTYGTPTGRMASVQLVERGGRNFLEFYFSCLGCFDLPIERKSLEDARNLLCNLSCSGKFLREIKEC